MSDVSIIIPVYNRVDLLRQTLISCAIQTFGDCEILVVDDASEEDVAQVVEWVRRTFEGPCLFRYLRQPRRGAPAARNRGVQEAAGRFIQFLDSDDLLHPQKIELQRKHLIDQPQLDMVFGLDEYFYRIPGDGSVLWNTPEEPALERFLWDDGVWHTGSPLWRRTTLERIGPWDEELRCYQDWEYHIRALCRGIRYRHVPMVLQYIRDHEASRISTSLARRESDDAKLRAARAAARELTRCAAWSSPRGDALAVFLLHLVLSLRSSAYLGVLVNALATAVRSAGSIRLKLAALAMLGAALATGLVRTGRRDSLARVHELANRFHAVPTHRSHWKRVRPFSAPAPTSLLEALENAHERSRYSPTWHSQ
jgi:hypothetical protein